MAQISIDFLDNAKVPGGEELSERETWWATRQGALERAGYMLRPRYRPDWKPSWVGTKKHHLDCEDGRTRAVSIEAFSPSVRTHGLSGALGHGCNSDL